ncbi:hypothetical protein BOTBODRAFT_412432 [Botryobasidium botryosum FD-172 SS1]|uniref:Uncharacterized protein n=1 Tax=Botryobasidium botryosum (strain FD-172 SS1) TaxID=930990 RepID=A0A067ML07_BOTB1|nr:hypothetical protein BOTBODRAFT_412432 [Botryobasidium botryosum FD-172 SS1]
MFCPQISNMNLLPARLMAGSYTRSMMSLHVIFASIYAAVDADGRACRCCANLNIAFSVRLLASVGTSEVAGTIQLCSSYSLSHPTRPHVRMDIGAQPQYSATHIYTRPPVVYRQRIRMGSAPRSVHRARHAVAR